MKTLPQFTNFEYRSKEEINGWPLIHINFGTQPESGRPRVANGVVAIGNVAFGVVSIGAAAFGIVALGGFGMGVVSLAGFALGIITIGAVALGYEFALGAVVNSAKIAFGTVSLDLYTVVWSLLIAALVAFVIWGLRYAKTDR